MKIIVSLLSDCKDCVGGNWWLDQWITTFGIISNGLCSVPQLSGLWNLPGLKPIKQIHASNTIGKKCWLGKGWDPCSKGDMGQLKKDNCKYWHFYGNDTLEDHVQKFNLLTGGKFDQVLDSIFARL